VAAGRKLTLRALNRATLARQFLLKRTDAPAVDVIRHLAGLQAQTPLTWYTGLWTRIADFDPHEVGALVEQRELVRMALMRNTVHLVTADDCVELRALTQDFIERSTKGSWGRHWVDLDRDAVAEATRALVDEQPLMFNDIGKALLPMFPGRDAAALGQSARASLAMVQTPPRGVWGKSGHAKHTTIENWLGRSVAENPSREQLVLRYLAAFGPASVKDAQTWSGLTKLKTTFETLRDQLVTFSDEHDRELFDLPDAPRPNEDTPAPVRFMYDYENLFLSHDDRSRVVSEEYRSIPFVMDVPQPSTVLIDGFIGAVWSIDKAKTMTVQLLRKFPKRVQQEVEQEASALLHFLHPGAAGDVQIVQLG
jgi:hypothetical protein